MPWVFVAIWSTGFVVARLAMPHVPPLSFLTWRYALSVLAFALWVRLARVAWPRGAAQWAHLGASGVLMHAGYLGGVWAAVRAGAPAGTVALIVGLQPLLTALWESQRGRQAVAPMQWLGLLLGLAGLVLVVWPKMGAGEVTGHNLGLALLALVCITAGTLYQKLFVQPVDVRTGNAVQLAAALLLSWPFALLEAAPMVWHVDVLLALAWSVLGLSLGGSSLLMLLIQRGAATHVTSLLYLVPPCTALLAWLMFDERLGLLALAGMGLCAVGVVLVRRGDVR
ncbi:DMT family transporter [Aquabacterium sp. OR-4]|uniref:DMT family transporter n=1 Tax=Aquabacterium sp. OR-4 TaxID=2978127 RepID=UPI0021B37C54|nr:DMT family transporter [Aquabacterium sp. OR-4]MDT7836714.1 DMT family transporter [Aquabacterium sp. OR-4]